MRHNIILVVARKRRHLSVAHFEHARGEVVDEVTVVRDKDHRAGEILQRVQQDILGAHVEVVGGLVEQHEVAGLEQHAGQRVAIALAAREHADLLEHIVAGKEKRTQDACAARCWCERGATVLRSSIMRASGSSSLY